MAAKSMKQSKKDVMNNFISSQNDEENEGWFANGLHRFIIVFSVMWFAIVAVYITSFFGWSNLFSMLPNEFSGFMAGITLPLAIVWVIMAYIDRGANFKNETQMLRNSLNQVIFPDSNGSEATKMIADAIKSQVADLKDVTRDVCAQSDVIKRDLTERVQELQQLAAALDKYSSQTMSELNAEIKKLIDNFSFVTEKATSATADFRVNTMQMKDDSEKLVNLLTPMVNQMVTAAERVKEVVDVNNENIAHAQDQLNQYSESSKLAIGRIIETWAEKGENLQKAFLRTSENCEELFRRLDSGISHIESSITEQKQVVETQSALIDKNSAYLDNKLGEYGKLISLEVEAMVARSGTLEANIQSQIKNMREATAQVTEAFSVLGNDISGKRKLLETESLQMVNNINMTVSNLGEEMKHLREFYEKTQNQNSQFSRIFAEVGQNLKQIEDGLQHNINSLHEKTTGILDNFNSVNTSFAGNIAKLTQSSDNLAAQSKANAEILLTQDGYMNKALAGLEGIAGKIAALNKTLSSAGKEMGVVLNSYEGKISGFNDEVNKQLAVMQDQYTKTQKQMLDYSQKFKEVNMDKFMKTSAEIIQELETLAIDINSIFNKSGKEDELWKKYYDGDHAVFTRFLAKNMSKKEILALREDYEKKTDFRLIVDKYLEDFNSLIAVARENERSSTLLALISGSDIGKVYYILARALGKVN
ncbi:MAG: hypothetical protein IJ778_01900 [Alphaproteobacteria bacterium]|nr:hypothetical protein [Alphaproteobacteria bacterium]